MDKQEFFEQNRKIEAAWGRNPFKPHKKKKTCCCGSHSYHDLKHRNKLRELHYKIDYLLFYPPTHATEDEESRYWKRVALIMKYKGKPKWNLQHNRR